MADSSTNNQTIAKNTLFMYFRMFLTLIVGLYTSRVVLQTLGIEDYGLFNVIGGIIGMFGFINGAMSNATSRFITFNLGKGDIQKTNNAFNLSLLIHLGIAVLIIILGETIGLWYLYNKLVVPDGRFDAALWLYQLTILSSFITILIVPFNSAIIAHEKMSAFAYISILDVVLKLVIVFLLIYAPYDKLVFYGTLLFAIQLLDFIIYISYCRVIFIDTRINPYWNKNEFKEMFGYAGWNMLGSSSFVFYNQGINLILNFFCGPAVNAARGIAHQVEGIIKQFASNVQTAVNPQIIKSYAKGDLTRMHQLIFASSKYCFYLLFLVSLPIVFNAKYLLTIWLGEYPEHTENFITLMLCSVLMDCFINPLWTANNAYGKVRNMQIAVTTNSYLYIPVLIIAMKLTRIPEVVFLVYFISRISSVIVRLVILRKNIQLSLRKYISKVFYRIIVVIIPPIIASYWFHSFVGDGFTGLVVHTILTTIVSLITIYFVGLDVSEKNFLKLKIRSIIKL